MLLSKRMALEKEFLEWLRIKRLEYPDMTASPSEIMSWLDYKGLLK